MGSVEQFFTDYFKEQPDFQSWGVLLEFAMTFMISLMFGIVLKGLYHYYFRNDESQDSSIARSLLLITPAFASVFFLVKTSIALSFGLLGSLSLVRYRTPVKRGEDVAFIVFASATALSAATGAYFVGVFLCAILFIYSDCKKRFFEGSRFGSPAVVTFNTTKKVAASDVLTAFTKIKLDPKFLSSRSYDGITSMVFRILVPGQKCHDSVNESLKELDDTAQISIFYPSERLGI